MPVAIDFGVGFLGQRVNKNAVVDSNFRDALLDEL